MANNPPIEKKITAVAALAECTSICSIERMTGVGEGASIRGIDRMTGVNRNTNVSCGLRVGADCAEIMDTKMRDRVRQNPTHNN